MLNSTLIVNKKNCPSTCNLCVDACANKKFSPNVFIEKVDIPELDYHSVSVCNQCSQPLCMYTCPTGAISQLKTGTTIVDTKKCIGCGLCNMACPYGGIYPHKHNKEVEKCILCGQCAKACPENILEFKQVKPIEDKLQEDLLCSRPSVLCRLWFGMGRPIYYADNWYQCYFIWSTKLQCN